MGSVTSYTAPKIEELIRTAVDEATGRGEVTRDEMDNAINVHDDSPSSHAPIYNAIVEHDESELAHPGKFVRVNEGPLSWKDSRVNAVGDNVADDTAAIQRAFDLAEGGETYAPPTGGGIYRITDTVYIGSKTTYRAAREASALRQATAGKVALASKAYRSATPYGPGGSCHIKDLLVRGAPGAGAHGIVLLDFRSSLSNCEVRDVGGDGVRVTKMNDAGDAYTGGTLVENRISDVDVFRFGRYGMFVGEDNVLSDGFIERVNLQSVDSGSAISHIKGQLTAWRIDHLHTYGVTTSAPIDVTGGYLLDLDNIEVEHWTNEAIRLVIQRGVNIGKLTVTGPASGSGLAVVRVFKLALYPGDGLNIDNLTIINDQDLAMDAIASDADNIRINLTNLNRQGAFASRVGIVSGFGTPAVKHVESGVDGPFAIGGKGLNNSAVKGDLIANRGGNPGSGVVYFGGSNGAHYLYYDGVWMQFPNDKLAVGGPGNNTNAVKGDIIANRGGDPGSGAVFFGGSNGSHYVLYNGVLFQTPDPWEVFNFIRTIGAEAGFMFRDRTTNRDFQWFASGDVARLFDGGVEILNVKKGGAIADGETALLVRRNVGGGQSVVPVTMGAADSGGTGFKVLRVPN